jgi:SAM-dependent methyltransferase
LSTTAAARLARSEQRPIELTAELLRGHLQFVNDAAGELPPGARILDFGCGIGAAVALLTELGYDAYGVDTSASWAEDFDKYWHATNRPPREVTSRLKKIDLANYSIPFPDNTFDFCFSDQVLEHVFNYDVVFRELSRVLKPGAISVHRFPGPNAPMEAHVEVPFAPLCKYRWYLALWALMGKRSVRQAGLSWRQTLQTDIEMMSQCNYPTQRQLLRIASQVGVKVAFRAADGIRFTTIGRARRLVDYAGRVGLSAAALWLMARVSQRYMVIYGS